MIGLFISSAALAQPIPDPQPLAASSFIWPISKSASNPDLPQSSAYGPRLQAGRNGAYDYHQGIDIPTEVNTTLVAVHGGTIRIAGSDPGYADGIVQIDHGNGLYSNYIHVSSSLVNQGDTVTVGQAVALSGVGASGFPHLHFEIRGPGYTRDNAINPWRYLPYTDTVRHTIAITEVLESHSVWVRATTPADELDLNQISITVRDAATSQTLDSRVYDYEARNRQYQGQPALLDNPFLDHMLIQPDVYRTASSLYAINIEFFALVGTGPVIIEACAIDIKNNRVCTSQAAVFQAVVYVPIIQTQ